VVKADMVVGDVVDDMVDVVVAEPKLVLIVA
jgi:hypothetical protein